MRTISISAILILAIVTEFSHRFSFCFIGSFQLKIEPLMMEEKDDLSILQDEGTRAPISIVLLGHSISQNTEIKI
jgi:hypothetical protein